MTELPIAPNGLRYWVLPDAKQEKKIEVGGVTLTGAADADKEPPVQGRIVAVGDAEKTVKQQVPVGTASPGKAQWYEEAEVHAPACKYKRGHLVIFGKYAGIPHKFNDVDYTILAEEEILGRVIETPFDPDDPTDLS